MPDIILSIGQHWSGQRQALKTTLSFGYYSVGFKVPLKSQNVHINFF